MMTITNSREISLKNVAIIITAAGSSTRMGGSIKKEFLPFNNGTVLSASVKIFLKASQNKFNITNFIITIPENNIKEAKTALLCDKNLPSDILDSIHFVSGGKTRQESVFNGLKFIKNNSLPQSNKIVLIHDGARPFVSEKIINSVVDAAIEHGASVPGITPTDTQKEINQDGFIVRHLVRRNLTAVQTPQGFDFEKLYIAHEKCSEINNSTSTPKEFTDDTEVFGEFYGKVKVVEGDINNIKITYPSDLEKLK